MFDCSRKLQCEGSHKVFDNIFKRCKIYYRLVNFVVFFLSNLIDIIAKKKGIWEKVEIWVFEVGTLTRTSPVG